MKKALAALALLALAASPAMALLRNTPGQGINGLLVSRTTGAPITVGGEVYVECDGSAQALGAGTIAHAGNGSWRYEPTAAETNCIHAAFTFVAPNAVNQTWQVYTRVTDGVVVGVGSPLVTEGTELRVVRGDVVTLTFRTGMALTGRAATFTVKARATDVVALLSGTCTITDAANGICTYTTTTTSFPSTGRFSFDIQVSDDPGGLNPQTPMIGTITVAQDVNQ